ncbi:hypothetical protein BOX15_Mlig019951g2 [Macrostomum lignano]|uniref:FAD-dependent oxidoreductase domain-containing protein 2 n=1 Tax=Macrostomum lignano TaxID=282301 RepID=A0A267DFG3_9PLAT|nr:hypothetical protein BOX15_Mlig019951g2 [Macrostomum lignano]
MLPILILIVFLAGSSEAADTEVKSVEYCIVGAGPAGLQLAYFMQRAKRDYVVIERASIAGSFFTVYPRHGKLISINKRWTDSSNTEYTLRHDWNSLISDDPSLQLRHYSNIMFPQKEVLVKYLNDYKTKLGLKVDFNTPVASVEKLARENFRLNTTGARNYSCKVVVMATGLPNLRKPDFVGAEHTVGYDKVSVNASDFEGKRVLIIGKGNSAFETAQHIYGNTRFLHMAGRHAVRFAWSTHYVGDVRAVNNELLDTYQLKSLDGMFESESIGISRRSTGEFCLQPPEGNPSDGLETRIKEQQYCYDNIIRATGFTWDADVTAPLGQTSTHRKKYPRISHQFESSDVPGIFYAGTMTHGLDFREAAGGFIHGFRYTARALHRYLENRRHGNKWPGTRRPLMGLIDALVKRINEGSGTYQMFSFLSDIVLVDKDRTSFTLLEEVPSHTLHILPRITGHPVDEGTDVIVFQFEYGKNFSGARADTFHERRAGCDIAFGYECNFLHPVLYHYKRLPNRQQMFNESLKTNNLKLPEPHATLHLMEDFFTNFRQDNHLVPLVAFLESALGRPLTPPSMEQCLRLTLRHGEAPEYCTEAANRWSVAELMSGGRGATGVSRA